MPSREIAHAFAAILAWIAFILLWVLLYEQGKLTPHAIGVSLGTVAAIVAAVAIVTLAWVSHNVGIHRRKGPRKGRTLLAPRMDVDRLDRPVEWDFPDGHSGARKAAIVVVDLDGDAKRYREWS